MHPPKTFRGSFRTPISHITVSVHRVFSHWVAEEAAVPLKRPLYLTRDPRTIYSWSLRFGMFVAVCFLIVSRPLLSNCAFGYWQISQSPNVAQLGQGPDDREAFVLEVEFRAMCILKRSGIIAFGICGENAWSITREKEALDLSMSGTSQY